MSQFRLGFETRLVAPAVLLGGVLAWLWPIGIGGMMPIGGDVTQFFLGLMAFFRESLEEGRLPVWNDLWGYGFPGLAESQMGVFYPVHLLLYRWLNTETAYVVSLVAHTLWGASVPYWAARRMGTSRMGATLAAFCWTTSGFFLVHLAHPWGYTTGCWMPWAWGLGWSLLAARRDRPKPAYPFLLALVLALQLLPGHFQLAFLTQCGLVLMVVFAAVRAIYRACAFRARRQKHPPAGFSLRGAAIVLLALAWAFPLAAVQLVPTARLAQLAGSQRDFGYLSDFASPPFHLVNYVAPGLFHRSPLWRPLVWDPFHAMPEEHLTYVGLVPFFLACMTVVREWRRDASVRLLAILGRRDAGAQSWALRSGIPLLDQAARIFLLPGSVALERGHRACAGVTRGEGIRSLAGMGASRPLAETVGPAFDLLGGSDPGLDRAGTLLHGQAGMAGSRPGLPASLLRAALEGRAEIRDGPGTGAQTSGGPAHRVRALADDPAAQVRG